MHIYTSTLILLALMVILPDWYIYQRFLHNRTKRSTCILHALLSIYFIFTSLSILLNINHIYNPNTSFRLIMFVTVMGALYIPKIVFCTFDLLFVINKKRKRCIQYCGYVAAIFSFLLMLHGIFHTRFDFEKTDLSVSIPNLPSSFEGYKIVQISDFHLGTFAYSQNKLGPLMDSINAQHPDLIVFTGDMVNNFATECIGWQEVFNRLDKDTKKLAILGNHDYSEYFKWEDTDLKDMNKMAVRGKIRDFGFQLLLDETCLIGNGSDTLSIVGMQNWGKKSNTSFANPANALESAPATHPKILLLHDPTFWEDSICGRTDIALTLSGHTHAAQIGIEIGKLKLSPAQLIFKHWDGLYEHQGQSLIVSRGIGCVGIPLRLGMNPQYSVITLRRKQ